jgi:hypothetical protein
MSTETTGSVAEAVEWFLQKDPSAKVWITAADNGINPYSNIWIVWVKPGPAHGYYMNKVLIQRW